jgi:hypothetical protein
MALATLVLLQVLVRVDAVAMVKPAMVAALAAEARNIWKPYGVDVRLTGPAGIAAGDTGGAEELRLVITDRVLPSAHAAPDEVAGLGWIEFLGPEQPSRTITVSTTAALRLSERATWAGMSLNLLPGIVREQFLGHALGRAVAHEIGHFLLRSTAHTRSGLMRPQFPADEVMDDHVTRFRLEPAQAAALDARMTAGPKSARVE